jgi:hypothetical protein
MKYFFIILFLIQFPLLGQEFLFSNIYADHFTTNQYTSEVYFKDYFTLYDYYIADLRTMVVKPSGFTCLPVFPYKTNKMIYSENDKMILIDYDRNKKKVFTISDYLNYSEYFNPFSPNGEYAFLKHFIYSFKDSSLQPIDMDSLISGFKWISDTTLIASEWISSTGKNFLVEYSINSSRKDTFYWFSSDMHGSAWDYDIIRNKIYYSTFQVGSGGGTKLRVYDQLTQIDTVLYEYPKDKSPDCPSYYPGVDITQIKWSGDYNKMSFLVNYLLDGFATDIYTYCPDSNKITKVTNGCMHYGVKQYFDWANHDTLVYSDISQFQLYGINIPHITSIKGGSVPSIPNDYVLSQNYPNPFNPSTVISYSLPSSSNIKLIVYNTLGQTVKILENSFKKAGNYSINFNAADLPSGIYFYKLDAAQFSQVKKMILIK